MSLLNYTIVAINVFTIQLLRAKGLPHDKRGDEAPAIQLHLLLVEMPAGCPVVVSLQGGSSFKSLSHGFQVSTECRYTAQKGHRTQGAGHVMVLAHDGDGSMQQWGC